MLHRFFNPAAHPRHRRALPATNDSALWLPAHLGTCDPLEAAALYRAMLRGELRLPGFIGRGLRLSTR